jgi:hypothetical protein
MKCTSTLLLFIALLFPQAKAESLVLSSYVSWALPHALITGKGLKEAGIEASEMQALEITRLCAQELDCDPEMDLLGTIPNEIGFTGEESNEICYYLRENTEFCENNLDD